MTRADLIQILAGDAEAVRACRLAVEGGAPYSVDNAERLADRLFHTARRRLRLTRRTGQRTLGLDEAVGRLEHYGDDPVITARVDCGPWAFVVWMSPDSQSMIACAGVERPTRM